MAADFYVHNLGCKVNRAESDLIAGALLSAGGALVRREDAEVIVINTCTVTAEAHAKTRKAVRRAAGEAGRPWVIATGCAIALDREGFTALGDKVIAEPDRLLAQERAAGLLGLGERPALECEACLAGSGQFNTRRGIKIQDGCDNACSYCIVPAVRGVGASRPLDEVCGQVRAAEAAGAREIVLTGVNIGAYRWDGKGLDALLEELLADDGGAAWSGSAGGGQRQRRARLRLSSLEPQHVTQELLELMARERGRLCAHVHMPLQSGCDRTLAQMGRLYDTAFFAAKVDRLRGLLPHVALTTDVMVGFPGESDDDFAQSLAFCEEMGFARMHVFRYSRRPGTPAAARADQVAPEVSAARAAAMRSLAQAMELQDLKARVGSCEDVLVERDGRGRSESYHRVKVPHGIAAGALVPMQFVAYRDTLLTGVPTEGY